MTLSARLAALGLLLVLLPALCGGLVARQLLQQSLALGLSDPVDSALESGLRQVRLQLDHQRQALQQLVDTWPWDTPTSLRVGEQRLRADRPGQVHESDRVELIDPRGGVGVVQAGRPTAAGTEDERGPPASLRVERALGEGWTLRVERALDPGWRRDAAAVAEVLQLVRGLTAARAQVERSFWWPWIAIYTLAALVAMAGAFLLARGVTVPLHQLLRATDAVAGGRRDVQVEIRGRDEVARLGQRFNVMVRTLDAQGRRLIDLEKMAAWREMARVLAHEVKNPLTPIQLTVEEMRSRYRGSDPSYRKLLDECARIVVEEVDSLRRVVDRFREFSRPVELSPRRLDLNQLVRDVAALSRDLTVELDLAREPTWVEADSDRLRQVLMNLLQNARQAMAEQSSRRVWITTKARGATVALDVEDEGPGIPPDQHAHVFEPYRSNTPGGLGLGLALVKGIALAHGGTIEVRPPARGGARFSLVLPAADPHSAQEDES